MSEFITRLSSRKFLLAAAAVLGLIAEHQYPEAVAVVLGYLGVEGYADVTGQRNTEA